jgi:hypothetical protein
VVKPKSNVRFVGPQTLGCNPLVRGTTGAAARLNSARRRSGRKYITRFCFDLRTSLHVFSAFWIGKTKNNFIKPTVSRHDVLRPPVSNAPGAMLQGVNALGTPTQTGHPPAKLDGFRSGDREARDHRISATSYHRRQWSGRYRHADPAPAAPERFSALGCSCFRQPPHARPSPALPRAGAVPATATWF